MKQQSHASPHASVREGQPTILTDSPDQKDGNNSYFWGSVLTYPAHSEILKQDTPARGVYFIEKGMVKLVRVAPNGHQVIAGIRRRHWLIGAPAVILGKPYSFTAVALIQSSLRFIPAHDFIDMVKNDQNFSWQLHRVLSQEIFNQLKRVEAVSCMSAKDRLIRFLGDLTLEQESEETDKLAPFCIPFQNQELAQLMAVTPEHLCRLLKKIEQDGIIRRDKGMLLVINASALIQTPSVVTYPSLHF